MKHTNIIHNELKRYYYRVHVMGEPRLHIDIEPEDIWSQAWQSDLLMT